MKRGRPRLYGVLADPGLIAATQASFGGSIVVTMNLQTELRDFLVSRRARITPEAAGVVPFGSGKRRVAGLRREEVAHLAGVSVEYYTRFERGRTQGVSAEVVDAVARALQLDEVEIRHLRTLVAGSRPGRSRTMAPPTPHRVPEGIQAVLDALTIPAIVQNDRLDFLAANALGRVLYPMDEVEPGGVFNAPRFVFLDPKSKDFFRDLPTVMRNNVALLRVAAASNPNDTELCNLIGQLSTQSKEFSQLWAQHDVVQFRVGPKKYRHPLVGDVDLTYQTLIMPAFPGLTMLVYTWQPDSPTAEAMQLLSNWTAPLPLNHADAAGTRQLTGDDQRP